MKTVRKIAAFALLALPNMAMAITVPYIPGLPKPSGGSSATIDDLVLDIIINILLPMAGLIAVLFIIIGGYQYLFSGANEDLAEKGKKTLTNSIIGLVIIILSYAIVTVIANSLRN